MRSPPMIGISERFWRMLSVRRQKEPLSSGSHQSGGRWNPFGTRALYLSSTYPVAIEEYHRSLVRPGTLAAYDVRSDAIADLRAPADEGLRVSVQQAITEEWLRIAAINGGTPEGWRLAGLLIEIGAHGALVPSSRYRGGTNLVLWRGGEAGGARVRLIDPERELG